MSLDARGSWFVAVPLVAVACTAAPGSPRAAAGVQDSGTSADAGPNGDGGSNEDGGPAGAGALRLYIGANPLSVLSAVATVAWSTPLASVAIHVRTDGGSPDETPTQSLAGASSPIKIPIFPLQARTTYSLDATGADDAGMTVMSNAVTFTTGALPADIPVFITADGGMPSPGYTLVARLPFEGATTQDYVTIVDGRGAPVWYYPATPPLIGDFQQQPDGTFTLALKDASQSGGSTTGAFYRQVDSLGVTLHTWEALAPPATSPPSTFLGTDDHEIRVQSDGDALLFGLVSQTMDLSAYGGRADALVLGDVLERVSRGGVLRFSWNTFDHLDVANIDRAATPLTNSVVDFTHANAIDVLDDGNYLVSLRNLSQLLKIDANTGDILWKLGGADGDFTFVSDPLGSFSCQHGGRELPNGDILLLDDGNGHSPPQSRAVEYQLDTTMMTATLVWSAEDDPPLYASIMGFAQRLENGNTLVTYGLARHVQEVDPGGAVLWDLTGAVPDSGFYRAFRVGALSPDALVAE